MSSRDEQQEEYNLLRIEALEGRVKELELKVTELEDHLIQALNQGYQFKV